MKLKVILHPAEEGGYWAEIPEGCVSEGDTRSEALENIREAAQGWLEAVKDVLALGKPIVAVGGGGYNQTTVPRMWTLATAILLGLELPDDTPEDFSFRPHIPTMRPSDRHARTHSRPAY